jgi:hypothetical protein
MTEFCINHFRHSHVVASALCEATPALAPGASLPCFYAIVFEPGDCFVEENTLLATTLKTEINSLSIKP